MAVPEDEDLLLALLNSAPVVDGRPTDELRGEGGAALAARFGGTGSSAERAALRRAREALQGVVRGRDGARSELEALLASVSLEPRLDGRHLAWQLRAPDDERLAARVLLAWSRVEEQLPGRLRACANTECNLFLVDHSRPGTAKWCSMATCGNRMKARAHSRRVRAGTAGDAGRR